MIRISTEKAQALHTMMAAATGGSDGIRSMDLLESALEGAFATFGGEELYPTIEEKGARLGFSLISNHAFIDGNKRIGVFVMLVFLEINGIALDCTDDDVIAIGLGVASGKMDYEDLLKWVLEHKK